MTRVNIDTTFQYASGRKVKLKSKAKYNDCWVTIWVAQDPSLAPTALGYGSLAGSNCSVSTGRDQMDDLLAHAGGDSVMMTFDKNSSSPVISNVRFT